MWTGQAVKVAVISICSRGGLSLTLAVLAVARVPLLNAIASPDGSVVASQVANPSGPPLTAPLGLDLYLPAPPDNPITLEKLTLGERLFGDVRLSADGRTSCASCHQPDRAFTDGRRTARGVFGRAGRRNVPSILNRGYGTAFFWDARVRTLEDQVRQAISGATDLGLPVAVAAARVSGEATYDTAFQAAFAAPASADGLVQALATFVRGARSGDSPFDRFIAGDSSALGPAARRGSELFYGRARCGRCHAGPVFTDDDLHNTGVSWGRDAGRFEMTRLPEDRGRFKTPSLRNVALTGPYMHDGSIDTLEKVVEFYDRGGGPNPNLDSAIRPLRLTSTERSELVVFLRALQSYGIIDLAERPRDVAQYARAPLTGPRHTQHAVPKAAGPALGAARR